MAKERYVGIASNANNIIQVYEDERFRQLLGQHVRDESHRDLVGRVVGLARAVNLIDLRLCPETETTAIDKAFDETNQLFNALREKMKSPIPVESRNHAILTSLAKCEGEIYNIISKAISLWLASENKYIEQKNLVDEIAKSIRNDLDDTRKACSAKREDLEQISKGLGDTVAMITAGLNGTFFNLEADAHEKARTWWLLATIVFASAAGWFVYTIAEKANGLSVNGSVAAGYLVQTGLAKALVFSALLTATLWCGRMFKAYSHNALVNRHRANSINSFLQIMQMNPSPAVKDAALIAVTQCIFSHQSSGLVDDKADSDLPSRIVEITRGVVSGKTSG